MKKLTKKQKQDTPELETDLQRAERETGCKYGEPFFIMNGLALIADDLGEVPCVTIKMGDKSISVSEEEMTILYRQMYKGVKWCEDGYCQGIC